MFQLPCFFVWGRELASAISEGCRLYFFLSVSLVSKKTAAVKIVFSASVILLNSAFCDEGIGLPAIFLTLEGLMGVSLRLIS